MNTVQQPTTTQVINNGYFETLLAGFDRAIEIKGNQYAPGSHDHRAYEAGARKAGRAAVALSQGRIGAQHKNWLAEAYRLYRKVTPMELRNRLFGSAHKAWRSMRSAGDLAAHSLALQMLDYATSVRDSK